jgi:YD repeat-containing protein
VASAVVGAELGLGNTTLQTLGLQQGNAALGQAGEKVYVNLGTGNLVLQRQDELLLGRGLGLATLRTYNSQGVLDGDNSDNWRIGFYRQLGSLEGALNGAGSSIVRTAADGASERYVWDAARNAYLSTAGAGAYDMLRWQGSAGWLWTDGSSGVSETYRSELAGAPLLLRTEQDADGNLVHYQYGTNGLLLAVVSANGERTELIYDQAPGREANLLELRIVLSDVPVGASPSQTRVRYVYDELNRLAQVRVDLTPQDNSMLDGQVYVTRYTYEGSSRRINSVTQSDGSRLNLSYDTAGRVRTLSDALGATTLYGYDSASTTVTDALGNVTRYGYDSNRQLTSIESAAGTQRFGYTPNGDLALLQDAEQRTSTFWYDPYGNLIRRQDVGGELRMTYNARNQLSSELRVVAGEAKGGLLTRYLYDGGGLQLRYVISAEGRVTEYRYNGSGQRVSSMVYTADTWQGAGEPQESVLDAWVAAIADKSKASRSDYRYDFRGQLAASTVYAQLDGAGNGIAGTAATTTYVYDASGRLLQTLAPTAVTTASTTQLYDGLGRVLAHSNALGQITRWVYTDGGEFSSGLQVTQTAGNGSVSSSVYDRGGHLLSRSSAGSAWTATTQYVYDANGRLRVVTDPTGVRNWFFYDAAGRQSGQVDGDGSLTEYRYDGSGLLLQTRRYAQAALGGLNLVQSSLFLTISLDQIRPLADAARDQLSWNLYDKAGRLNKTVAANGAVTETIYDAAGRVQRVIAYANAIDTSILGVHPDASQVVPVADAARDRVTRYFHDRDGLLRGALDAEGYLTEILYDSAGRVWQTIAYALLARDAAADSVDAARPASSTADIRRSTLYDAAGQISGEIDAEGFLTEHAYDTRGNRVLSTRHAIALSAGQLAGISSSTSPASLGASSSADDQVSGASYDALDRVIDTVNAEATHARYEYDVAGNLVARTAAFGSEDARVQRLRFDAQGLLVAELNGEGSAALASLGANAGGAQIESVWEQYATRYQYDLAGRRIAMLDANGGLTRYWYDTDGQLRYTINALGEVQGWRYDTLGRLISQTRYANAVNPAALTSRGGLVDATLENLIVASSEDSTLVRNYLLDGSLASSVDESGQITQYRYNSFGEQVSLIQPLESGRKVITNTDYDRRGLLRSSSADVGGVNATSARQYDAFGRLLAVTDAMGASNRFGYDRLGRQVQSIDPLDIQRSSSYDAFDRVLTQTDGNGKTTITGYDAATRSLTVTTPEGISMRSVRNRHGETVEVTDGRGNVTRYGYDRNGNLTSSTDAAGNQTRSRYDRLDKQIEQTDARGIVTLIRYDAAQRVLSRTVDPGGLALTTRSSYDVNGQVLSVTAPDQSLTRIEYDRRGQVVAITRDANGLRLRTTYTWDARGLQLSVTEAAGSAAAATAVYTYDGLGRRLTETLDPNGLKLVKRYVWDASGQLQKTIDAAGNVTCNLYDAAGRLQAQLDPMGALTVWRYDAEGRQTAQLRYAKLVDLNQLPDTPTLAAVMAQLGNPPASQITRSVYDGDGRAIFQIDALGQLTRNEYNGNGNLLRQTQYAKPVSLAGESLQRDAVLAALAAVVDNDDRATRYVYDAANRLVYAISAMDTVTAWQRDAAGNVVQEIAYFNTVLVSGLPSAAAMQSALAAKAAPSLDRKTRSVYDNAGRSAYLIDAMGYVLQRDYDAAGRVVRSLRFADPLLADANTSLAALKAMLGGNALSSAIVETQTWDASGRLLDSTDGSGVTTHRQYDAAGRLTDLVLAAGTPAALRTRYNYDLAGRLLSKTEAVGSANAASTRYRPDAMGNVLAVVDARGVELAETDTAWALNERRALGLLDAAGQARLAATLTQVEREALLADFTTLREFDANGRVIRETDPLGGITRRDYDAFGNLVQITDPRGNSGGFAFDALNRVITHIDPLGQEVHTAYTASGKIDTLTQGAAITRFSYDKLDRLRQTTDAEGYVETQSWDGLGNRSSLTNKLGGVTRYTYDQGGKLASETLPITAIDSAGQNVAVVNRYQYDARGNLVLSTEAAGLPEQRVTRYEYDANDRLLLKSGNIPQGQVRYVYDARGNLTETRDANGNRQLSWYDERQRKTAEVAAEGTLTVWRYNAGTQAIARLVFGDPVAIPASAGGTAPAAVNPLNVRETLYAFDANQRLSSTTLRNQTIGCYNAVNGQYQLSSGDLVTRQDYDAAGNVVRSIDPNGNVTRFWYDRMGQKILQVDAEGYATAWRHDANGRVLEETRFANRFGGQTELASDGGALAAAWPSSADDRITRYRYDRNGNVLEERHLGVVTGQLDVNGGLITATADALVSYTWNGLGLVTQKTDALGNAWNYGYDLAGRKNHEEGAAFTDFEGARVLPSTDLRYDGLGNLLSSTRRGKSPTGSQDQITGYVYDANGRLAREIDPMGAATEYGYDAVGNLMQKRRQRTDADAAKIADVTNYRYDARQRQIEQSDVATGMSQQTRYNAWGEVSAKGTNGGWQQFAQYDGAGRLIKSNTDDGASRAFVYDAVGNVTLKIESSGADLRTLSLEQMLEISNGTVDPAAQDAAAVHLTISAYDKRNQLTDSWQPKMVTSRADAELQSSTASVRVDLANHTGMTVTAATGEVSVPLTGGTGKTEAGRAIVALSSYGNLVLTPVYAVYRLGFKGTGALLGSASVYLSIPSSVDAWGAGNVGVEVRSTNLQTGAVTTSIAYYAADVRSALIAEVPVASAAGFSLSVSVYKTFGSGKVLLSNLSLGIPLALTAPPPVSSAIPKLTLFRSATGKPASVLLYYRPSGSSGPFQSLRVPGASSNAGQVSDAYAFDWSALPKGSYELRLLAVESDGAIQDFQTGSMSLSADSANISMAPATYGAALASSLVFETGNLLHLTAQGSTANSMLVSMRPAGSNGAWSTATVLKPSAASGAATPGWFSWNHGSLTGDYEVIFESRTGANGDGDLVNKLYSTIRLGSSPAILSNPVPYQQRVSAIRFDGNALNAVSMALRYRVLGSNAAWNSVTLLPTVTGSGSFVWDATALMPPDQGSLRYEFEYESTAADGLVQGKGGGSLQLGSGTGILSQYVAPPKTILRFTPPSSAPQMRLYYRLRNGTDSFAGPIVLTRAADGSFSWDAASLKPASGSSDFEYFHELIDAQGQSLGRSSGYFSLGTSNNATALQWVIKGVASSNGVIHLQQSSNAFGEIAQETDGFGRITDFRYNTLGLLTQTLQPTTTATLENGYIQTLRPETRYVHDLAGRAIAEQDANGMLTTQNWLAGFDSNTLMRQADGSVTRYGYDIFGNLRSAGDALGRISTYDYDRDNRLTSLTRPAREAGTPSALSSASIERYEYDEAGQRIAHTNALGRRERTWYDSLGRIIRSSSFESRVTQTSYRYADGLIGLGGAVGSGIVKTTTDADGRSLVDSTDLFGRLLTHQDLGGHSFSYRYNNAGWLIAQTGSTGQDISYEYYANGLLRGMRDLAAHTLSTYEYDAAGNRIFEGYALLAADNLAVRDFAQQSSIEYDALNRVKRITDPRYSIDYEYDAAGNRRHMQARYHDGVNGSVQTQDYWYAYDAANRFTTTMGSLSGARASNAGDASVFIQRGKDGVQLAYDLAGQRRQATYQDANGLVHSERYTYTADGYLEDTSIDNVLRARRQSDALGRVVSYSEYNATGSLSSQRKSVYDADSLVKRETSLSGASTDYVRMADGTLASATATDAGTTTTTWYGYEWWDSAKQSTITAQPYNANAPGWKAGTSHLLYDVNGHLKEARDEVGQAGFRYTTNAEGLIMTREEHMPNALRLQKYYYVDGKRVGDVGNGGPSRMDYVQALAQSGQGKTGVRSFSPVSSADFDQNYEPINAAYPAATPATYIVRAGDNLRSIAAQVWGDASMWYLIADANGLTGNEALTQGFSLSIPNKVTNIHNTSETFRVYNPGEAIGDITPNLPVAPPPPPPPGGGCGVLGTILIIVIAVVATVFTAGALTVGLSAGFSAIMSAGVGALGAGIGAASIGVSLAAGAAGSIASQAVGMALGMQDSFSWTGVATSALGAGVGAGMAQSGIGASIGKALGSSMAATVSSQVLGNVVTQAAATATGLQSKFDWRTVAATALGAAAGSVMGDALKNVGPTGARIGSALASSVMRGAAAGMNWDALVGQTIGNAVGDSIAYADRNEPAGKHLAYSEDEQAQDFARENNRFASALALNGSDPANVARAQWLGEYSVAGPGVGLGQVKDSPERAAEIARLVAQAHEPHYGERPGRRIEVYGVGPVDVATGGSGTAYSGYDEFGILSNPAAESIGRGLSDPVASLIARTVEGMHDFKFGALEGIDMEAEAAGKRDDDAAIRRAAMKHVFVEMMLPGSPQEIALSTAAGKGVGLASAWLTRKAAASAGFGYMADDVWKMASNRLDTLAPDVTKNPFVFDRFAGGETQIRLNRPIVVYEDRLVLRGDAARFKIVNEIGLAAKPSIESILKLDPNARIGFRGSLANGLKNSIKLGFEGERVAFDGIVATKNGGRYNGPQGYDADFFVVSDSLAMQLGNRPFFRNAARLDSSLIKVFDDFGRTMRGNPVLSAMKNERVMFRVFNQAEMIRKINSGDIQVYFLTGGAQ